MPLIAQRITLSSALSASALLDRVRELATGKLPMPGEPRWRGPVMWWLREQPGAIRLMPLSAPNYRAQQPSFTGTIESEGSGSRMTGRVTPHALTVGVTVFLLLMDAAVTTGGVVQEYWHRPNAAFAIAGLGMLFGAVAVWMLRLGVKWAASDIRRLLVAAASSSDPYHGIAIGTIRPTGALLGTTTEQSITGPFLLRSAGAIDLVIAILLIATPFADARVGRRATLLIAAVLTAGAVVLLHVANRRRSK